MAFSHPVILQREINQKLKPMETEKNIKDETLLRAEKTLYYNNLLIEQCNSWLSAEEGNRNMEKQIQERRKKELRIEN